MLWAICVSTAPRRLTVAGKSQWQKHQPLDHKNVTGLLPGKERYYSHAGNQASGSRVTAMAQTQDNETTNRKLNRLYRHRDGEINKKIGPTVDAVILEPIGGNDRVVAELAPLFGGSLPADCIGLTAAAFGLNTVLGNAIAGKAGDPATLLEHISERWESIKDGEWSEGREGPRIKYVLEAWAADVAERRGSAPTEAQVAAMRAKVEANEVSTKALLGDAGINAHYQAHAAQRAVERAKAAKAAQANSGSQGKFDPN